MHPHVHIDASHIYKNWDRSEMPSLGPFTSAGFWHLPGIQQTPPASYRTWRCCCQSNTTHPSETNHFEPFCPDFVDIRVDITKYVSKGFQHPLRQKDTKSVRSMQSQCRAETTLKMRRSLAAGIQALIKGTWHLHSR